MTNKKTFDYLLTLFMNIVNIAIETIIYKTSYNRGDMACKSLPNDRYSLDYEGKSLGIFLFTRDTYA